MNLKIFFTIGCGFTGKSITLNKHTIRGQKIYYEAEI